MKKDPFHNSTVFWDTASVFVHHYLPDIRKVSPNTVIAYRDSMNFFIDYLDTQQNIKRKDISYNDFSKDTIRSYSELPIKLTLGCIESLYITYSHVI